jgi:hypothetical protein
MPLADRIADIVLDLPFPPADELWESGGENIGSDPARPEDSSPVSRMAGGTTLSLGKALVGIGDFLHIPALSRLGANWMARALTWAPRLSEKMLGAQEAALRALLREFREGDRERALRRALPLTGDEARGGVPAGNARLPFHNIRYSLQKILGGRRGLSASGLPPLTCAVSWSANTGAKRSWQHKTETTDGLPLSMPNSWGTIAWRPKC